MRISDVFLAVLCGDERGGWIHPSLTAFLLETMKRRQSTQFHFSFDARPVTYARNLIVKRFLDSNCEWCGMVDNDVAPPMGLLDIVDAAPSTASIVVPKVFIPIAGYHPAGLGWRPIGATDSELWQELSDCATACIFIRRDAFLKIKEPYFQFDSMPNGAPITEDLVFCRKARKVGVRIFGNRHRSFECSHFRTVDLRQIAERGPEFDFATLAELQNKKTQTT